MISARTCLVTALSGFTLVISCYLIMEFMYGMFPSPETLARRYFDAVIKEDIASIVEMAGSDPGCQQFTADEAQKDIVQFGSAQTRAVRIDVLSQGGSDRGIRMVRIHFEYRNPSSNEWQHGYTQLLTDSNLPGLRYLCGRVP